MRAESIASPYPLWETIKTWLVDDNANMAVDGDFVGVFDGDVLAGAFLIKTWNEHCYEIHGGVDKAYWGKGPEICKVMGRAIFYKTPCLKIVAVIPEFNHLMRKCVQKAGLIQEGIITKSFLKWMKLHDQYVYGITKRQARGFI